EASHETPWSSLAVLRTAPPRHFVPLPLGTSCHSPSALRATPPASWGRNPKRPVGRLPRGAAAERATQWFLPRWSGSETGTDDDFPKDFSPWSGSETGEYGRRPGGGASEASHETPWSFPAVLRTAPPRHFVPLPQQAGGEIQRGQSDV